MVCLADDISVQATIKDNLAEHDGMKKEFTVNLSPSKSVDYLFSEVTSLLNYNLDQVEVVLVANDVSVSYHCIYSGLLPYTVLIVMLMFMYIYVELCFEHWKPDVFLYTNVC